MRAVFTEQKRRLVFERPFEVITPETGRDLPRAFVRMDEALDAGYAIAGYFSYECGTALAGIDAPRDDAVPLFAIGVFAPPKARDPDPTFEARGFAMPVALAPRRAYRNALAEIMRRLTAGDVYQVNLTVPFGFLYGSDANALFETLIARAGIDHGALVEHDDRSYISLSPELFLRFEADEIVTRPMKGTAPPGALHELASAKNLAEHVMIVDLLRNDLHRICTNVRVERLFEREVYPTFATMTSTIRGRLRADIGLFDIFQATFPCGSITGAPKRAAMQTIAALEAAPRGIAMGSIGYLLPTRRGAWNVAIRTIALDRKTGRAELRIGGGIVADSDAATEWAEIFVKRRLFEIDAEPVGLFETLRADAEPVDRAAHVDRMCDSAERLGIAFCPDDVVAAFESATFSSNGANDASKATVEALDELVRIDLAADGRLSTTRRAIDPAASPARVCIAPIALNSADPLLQHKTTRRGAYDAASAFARERGCFDALLRNERGSLADGARSTIFVRDALGRLATPPLADGALAGILRARLLATGTAIERTLTERDLVRGELFIGNAARGLLRAVCVP